jgi:hypothetical protein
MSHMQIARRAHVKFSYLSVRLELLGELHLSTMVEMEIRHSHGRLHIPPHMLDMHIARRAHVKLYHSPVKHHFQDLIQCPYKPAVR